MIAAEDYGVLKTVVATAGSIIAAAGAITLTWRGKNRWEPSEEDIPNGSRKVGGLVAAVGIVIIFISTRNASRKVASDLVRWATILAIVTVVALIAYGFIIGTQTYVRIIADAAGGQRETKLIGGFWLLPAAKKVRNERNKTVQEVLKGAAYDPDKVWSRTSRQTAKMCFVLCYLLLVVAGTFALTCVAVRIGIK